MRLRELCPCPQSIPICTANDIFFNYFGSNNSDNAVMPIFEPTTIYPVFWDFFQHFSTSSIISAICAFCFSSQSPSASTAAFSGSSQKQKFDRLGLSCLRHLLARPGNAIVEAVIRPCLYPPEASSKKRANVADGRLRRSSKPITGVCGFSSTSGIISAIVPLRQDPRKSEKTPFELSPIRADKFENNTDAPVPCK